MWLTLGDTQAITSKTVPMLIKVAEAELVRHERELREKDTATFSTALAARDVTLQALMDGNEDLRAGMEDEQRKIEKQIDRIDEISTLVARMARWFIFAVCVVGYILGSIGLSKVFSTNWILLGGIVFGLVVSASSSLLGTGPLQWSKKMELVIRQRVRRLLLPDTESSGRGSSILGLIPTQSKHRPTPPPDHNPSGVEIDARK